MSGSRPCRAGCTCGRHHGVPYAGQPRGAVERAWRDENRARLNEARRERRKDRSPTETTEKDRRSHLSRYGLTPDDFACILAWQRGRCAWSGCRRTTADVREGQLAIDHDHRTGLVRGLLCTYHNRLLGRLNLAVVKAMHEYLVHPPAPAALGHEVIAMKGPAVKHRRKARP